MPSLKALRTRIRSVKNTRQITKTMKMVAAAKVRKARSAVEGARPYAAKLAAVLADLTGSGSSSRLLTGYATVKTTRLMVFGSDRGLCGALNANLIKTAVAWAQEQQSMGRTVEIVAVGRKIRDGFKATAVAGLVVESHTDLGRAPEFSHAHMLGSAAREAYENGTAQEVYTLYAECVSMLTQTPNLHQLLPFAAPVTEGTEEPAPLKAAGNYEPSEEAVLEQLLPLNLNMQVFRAMLESAASEHAARMAAMDSATRNAGEMIKRLTIQYNRSRQAAITKELIEIISGAEAL